MGVYFRKGLNFGLLKVNFSKSGVGLSFGIKGLRVGTGPKGNYIHAGRKGVYYKETLPKFGDSENMLRLSWLTITLLMIVVGGIYFYLQANGNFEVMKELILKQLAYN